MPPVDRNGATSRHSDDWGVIDDESSTDTPPGAASAAMAATER